MLLRTLQPIRRILMKNARKRHATAKCRLLFTA